jgi:FixJ family two-component response regulator
MVMPEGISGMELTEQLVARKPSLKILFTSGYAVDQFDTGFLHKGNRTFLQKPYTRYTLATAVREVLDKKSA